MNAWAKSAMLMLICMCIAKYGIAVTAVIAAACVPFVLLLKWETRMAEQYPRWLGGMDDGFAPPSILDTDAQAIVKEAQQKITKTDDDLLAGASAEALSAAAGESPAQQNTGRMDTPRPPVRPAEEPMVGQGGNITVAAADLLQQDSRAPEQCRSGATINSRCRATEARLAHNQEVVGSTPTTATSVLPDRCGYAHQPVEGRTHFAGPSDTVNRRPVRGFQTGY